MSTIPTTVDEPVDLLTTEETPAGQGVSAFRWLFGSALAANLADGIARTAVPLLATTLTHDPIAIAVIGALSFVPWLAFGIVAGVIVDRIDRRVAMAWANGLRVAVALALTLVIAGGALSLPILFAATIAFGIGETLADNAANALIPAVVGRGSLERANGKILAVQIGVDHFIATPISGILFATAIVLPSLTAIGGYALAIVLAMMLPASVARAAQEAPSGVDASNPTPVTAREGLRYVAGHAYLRRMIVLTSIISFLFTFAQATAILLFLDEYGVSPRWIGFITAALGVGGLSGVALAPRAVERWGRGRVLIASLTIGSIGLACVGVAPSLPWAIVAYAVGAAGVASWNVPWGSLRQDIVPGRLLGRVIGVVRTLTWGLAPVATLLGGLFARGSLHAPYLIGGLGSLVAVAFGARTLLAADRQVSMRLASGVPGADDATSSPQPS